MPADCFVPTRIVIIAEAEADRRMVCGLIDRKLLHHAPSWWHDQDDIATQLHASREWCGLEPAVEFTTWTRLKHLTKQTNYSKTPGVRALGFDRLGPRHYDREAMRTALIHFMLLQPPPTALVVSRDLDKHHAAARRASLEEGAREAIEKGVQLVLALQTPMRGAWLLNGFVARDQKEQTLLAAECAAVRFDPCCRAEDMDVADEAAPRNARRTLRALTADNPTREEACWSQTDWQILRERGTHTGLTAFLDAVKDRLVQLVTGEPPR